MEDQERETRIDEDVEGHSHYAPRKDAPEAAKNDEPEGDEVEAHMHAAPRKDAPRKD